MTFSEHEFPGYHMKLEYCGMDIYGYGENYGIIDLTKKTGEFQYWEGDASDYGFLEGDDFVCELCPALMDYFDEFPEEIYVKIEEYK